ncbi:MAG: hypothetical protein AAB294_02265 [Pseudomonadota bacterium]
MSVSFALTLAIILAPVLPAFASASADAATPALHADHGKTDGVTVHADQKPGSCIQHDTCYDSCCATCAECFAAALGLLAPFVLAHVILSSAVPRLHDRIMAATHDRPPAV